MSGAMEFSRPQAADEIAGEALERSFEADAAERAALAERFDLVSLDDLSATLVVKRSGKSGRIRVDGRIRAHYAQRCVITLEPVAAALDEPFSAVFSDAPSDEADIEAEIDMAIEDEDLPDPIENNRIDLGELVAQQFAVLLDPYPRAEGAEMPEEGLSFGELGDSAEDNPFAVLKRLK
jgi:uncharacterized metal-binding protein YceD (DUF177 family)